VWRGFCRALVRVLALVGQMMTFVSRWFTGSLGKNGCKALPAAAERLLADRDISVAFVAGEGAQVYSLDAWRTLKNLPPVTFRTGDAA
jgi:hypothetical protein